MTRDDRLFLAEIVTACDEIASTLQAIDKQTFLSDIVVQGFVLNRLTIIGEAASKISNATRDRHVEVPWKAIIAMRNIVVHQYFAIDGPSFGMRRALTCRSCANRSPTSFLS
jgi:uncharacterized protein with HEPN domain